MFWSLVTLLGGGMLVLGFIKKKNWRALMLFGALFFMVGVQVIEFYLEPKVSPVKNQVQIEAEDGFFGLGYLPVVSNSYCKYSGAHMITVVNTNDPAFRADCVVREEAEHDSIVYLANGEAVAYVGFRLLGSESNKVYFVLRDAYRLYPLK